MAAARAYLEPLVGLDATDDASRIDALIEAAAALIEREAPGAPAGVKREAVVRMAGYLAQSDYGGYRSETIGDKSVSYPTTHAAMFRRCGAKALLSPWKKRRAL